MGEGLAGPCHPSAGAADLVQCCDSFLNSRCHRTWKWEVRTWWETLDCGREDGELPGAEVLGTELPSMPWGWVDTGEAGVDLGEG